MSINLLTPKKETEIGYPAQSKWSWRDWLAILALCVIPLFYFAPVIFSGQTFYFHDISTNYTPLNAFNTQMILQGELPLWNPYLYSGYPVTATMEASSLYPLNVILLLPLPIATTHMWYIVVHYMLLAVFTYLLTRQGLRLSPIPAFIAGLTFTFSGTMISQLTHFPIISALAWLPLIFFLYIRALDESKMRYAVGAGVVMALQISKAQPQMVLYTAGILALYACFAVVIDFYARKGVRSFIPFRELLVVVVVGVGLSAYQIFFTLELIQQSNRSGGITYDMITVLSYPPLYFIKFLIPHFFGAFQNYVGAGSFTEIHAYAGILTLILTVFAWLRPRNWRVWFFTTLMVVTMVLSLGRFTPAYHLLQYVPVLNYFRVPARWLLPATFCLSILAAYGTQTLIDNDWTTRPGLRKSPLRAGVLLVFMFFMGLILASSGLILWDVTHSADTCTPQDSAWRPRCLFANPQVYTKYADLTEHDPEQRDYVLVEPVSGNSYETEQIRELAAFQQRIQFAYMDMIQSLGFFLLVLSLGLSLVFLRWQGWIGGRLFGVLVILIILFDILTYGGLKANPTTDADYFVEEPDTVQFLKQTETTDLYRVFPTIAWIPAPHNVDYALSTLHFNFPSLYGIESIEGGITIPLKRHTAYMEQAIGQAGGVQMLGLANVKYIITDWNLEDNPDLIPVFAGERQNIFQNLSVLPRAFVVHQVEILNNDTAILNRLADSSFDLAGTLILEERPTVSLPVPPLAASSIAKVLTHKHNRVEIDVSMTDNGFLFLSDVYYPGWSAYVDGAPAHIYRANYLFRAVELTEGNHTVEFRYEPLSFRLGLAVSLFTVVALVIWVIVKKVKFGRVFKS